VNFALLEWLPLLAALAGAGVIAGILAGLLGVGGGIVIVPALDFALTSVGVSPAVALHIAVATSMATIIPTAAASARGHARRGAVDLQVIRRWSAPIALGALAGALLASRVQGRTLALVFAGIALLAAARMLLPLEGRTLRQSIPGGVAGAALPAAIGGISAMMGIGGGTLSVPSLTLCGLPVHRAVGTAALLGLLIAIPGTVGYLLAQAPTGLVPGLTVGYVSLPGFAVVSPLSWLAAPLGVKLAHSLDRRALSTGFGLFLLVVAGRMIFRVLSAHTGG
jgi:uncharacterized membrane protein YfcA